MFLIFFHDDIRKKNIWNQYFSVYNSGCSENKQWENMTLK